MSKRDNPDNGVMTCDECGKVVGVIETSEWIQEVICVECANKQINNDELGWLHDEEKKLLQEAQKNIRVEK